MKLYYSLFLALTCLGGQAMGGEKMVTAQDVIEKLNLQPLEGEGGYFRQTYKSDLVDAPATVFGFKSEEPRAISTAIYFLVVPTSFSALHRIQSDEIFHFYGGDPVEMVQIDEQGNMARYVLGSDIFNGQSPQVIVKKGVWQGSRLIKGGAWALLGTTVAPGFEFVDLEVADRDQLVNEFPQHSNDIIRYTREKNEKAH